MNMITKIQTISVSALLLASAQTVLAESTGEYAKSSMEDAVSSPTIRLAITSATESAKASVSYTNQNFESDESARELYGLLQRASKEVCGAGTMQNGRAVTMKSSRLRCYREALSNAVKKIDNEVLTRIHTG